MGTGEKGVGSDQRGRKQPDAQGPSMQSASIQRADCEQQKTHSQRQFVPLPGKRKVWGLSLKYAVRNTFVEHFSPQISINVKRKFKLGSGNKIIKWWHVVSGDEETMALLETEWGKINAQTSWNIKPCLSYADH